MYDKKLETTGLVLTSVIYNKNENLQADDLPANFRKHYWNIKEKTVKKPINVTRDDLEKLFDIQDPEVIATSLPFLEYEDLILE
jgi:hypothetical protein